MKATFQFCGRVGFSLSVRSFFFFEQITNSIWSGNDRQCEQQIENTFDNEQNGFRLIEPHWHVGLPQGAVFRR